jgi:hypothetical protein
MRSQWRVLLLLLVRCCSSGSLPDALEVLMER